MTGAAAARDADVRILEPATDLERVVAFHAEAQDYWVLAHGAAPTPQNAAAFFTDGPPGCDPAASHRLGLFLGDRLCGLAELSFGFPDPGDAYLGLMILAPRARGRGLGAALLSHVQDRAHATGARRLCLGVLDANPRGREFWEREGFGATGVSRVVDDGPQRHVIHRLAKQL